MGKRCLRLEPLYQRLWLGWWQVYTIFYILLSELHFVFLRFVVLCCVVLWSFDFILMLSMIIELDGMYV